MLRTKISRNRLILLIISACFSFSLLTAHANEPKTDKEVQIEEKAAPVSDDKATPDKSAESKETVIDELETSKNTLNLYFGYPPYSYGTTADPKGLYYLIIKAALVKMKAKIDVKFRPWTVALQLIHDNRGMLGGLFKTPQRTLFFDYSHAFYTEEHMAYVLNGSSFELDDLSDLVGKRVGLVEGWSYGETVDYLVRNNKIDVAYVKTNVDNFKQLSEQKVDLIVSDRVAAEMALYQLKLHEQVTMLSYPIYSAGIYIAANKKSGMKDFLRKFNEAIDDMKLTGAYYDLIWEVIAKERVRRIDALSAPEQEEKKKDMNIQTIF